MKNKIIIITLIGLFGFISKLNGQEISGVILDSENQKALSGVNVSVANTLIATTSDKNGRFILKQTNADNSITLIFSVLGYETEKIELNNNDSKELIVKLVPTTLPLDQVVVVSTKNQLSDIEQTVPVSLIPNKNIFENSVQNITDIIVSQPSISLTGAGYHKTTSIRGLARKRVVVLVDGHRISSERNEGPPGTYVNPLDIKNIEILRGPYSTLYGSDAVGGVVNIITQDFSQPLSNDYVGGVFSTNYQSIRNGYNANLLLNTKISDKVFFHFTVGKRQGKAYKDADNKEVQGTNYSEQSASTKITFNLAKNHILELNGFASLADSIGKPAFTDSINALHPKDNHFKYGFAYDWKNIASWLPQMSIKASGHRHEITARIYNYRPMGYGRVVNKEKFLYNDDYIYQHDFKFLITKKINVLLGFDFYQRDGIHIHEHTRAFFYDPESDNPFSLGDKIFQSSEDTIIDDSYQRSLGTFMQFNYNICPQFIINGGIRWNAFKTKANLTIKKTYIGPPFDYGLNEHETKEKKDDAFSGNFGMLIKPVKGFMITANVGQAFRVPSTKELFVSTMTPGGINVSNPDLVPEESFNLDFGLKYFEANKGGVSLSFFRNDINNMIILQWDSLHSSGVFQNKNALIYGGELSFDLKIIKRLSINGNVSYVVGEEENGDVLMDIPPLQVNFNTKYAILENKLFVSVLGRYNAKHTEYAVGDVPTDAFFVFDFVSSWRINRYFKATFSVTNVLNKYYREHYQYQWVRQPGRSFNAGIQIIF